MATRTDETNNLEEIQMEVLLLKVRMKIKKLWNNLYEFEMKMLEAGIKEEIEILKNKKDKVRKIMIDITKSKSD